MNHLAAAPAAGELEQRHVVVGARELLLDSGDRTHARTVQEDPLVGRRPGDEQGAAARRPGDITEDAGPREEQPGAARVVDVDEPHLASPRETYRDGEPVRTRTER